MDITQSNIPLSKLRKHRSTLLDALVTAMDETEWKLGKDQDGIRVQYGFPIYSQQKQQQRQQQSTVEGFHICSEHENISLNNFASFFHDACHFADTSNEMGTHSQIIHVFNNDNNNSETTETTPKVDDYEAIVRTGFHLPWPLSKREFLHYVTTQRTTDKQGRPCVLVAYHSFAEDDDKEDNSCTIPPAWYKYLRCPQKPSGQRATLLPNGRIRIEHCMTYQLKGCIGTKVQNIVFHRGHVNAYCKEWRRAMSVLATESKAGPPSTLLARTAGPERLKSVGEFKEPNVSASS